uniref:Uncharacterized protein n=1 Tax=Hippocampus comes TaxID=109280 RepID=A0A3Q2YD76_HIPCM
MIRALAPLSPSMTARATSTPSRGWTVRSRLSTCCELRPATASPTGRSNPSPSSSSRSKISTTTNPSSWTDPIERRCRRCPK